MTSLVDSYWEWRELDAAAQQMMDAAEGCGDLAQTAANAERENAVEAYEQLIASVPDGGWLAPCGETFRRPLSPHIDEIVTKYGLQSTDSTAYVGSQLGGRGILEFSYPPTTWVKDNDCGLSWHCGLWRHDSGAVLTYVPGCEFDRIELLLPAPRGDRGEV